MDNDENVASSKKRNQVKTRVQDNHTLLMIKTVRNPKSTPRKIGCVYAARLLKFLPSVISRVAVACVAGVIRFPRCLVFFRLLGCLVFSVARVSGVCSCSCVERFQLLVCRTFSVARVSSVFSC